MAVTNIRNIDSSHVSWLELFFDLSYIAVIGVITHYLIKHISVVGFLQAGFLFLVVWWSWVGHTFFSNRFGMISNSRYVSFLTFLQMLFVLILTILVPHALNGYAALFAVTYGVIRIIITLLYVPIYLRFLKMRRMSGLYIVGFTLGAALWIVSAFVPEPLRYLLWAIAWVFDFGTPFLLPETIHVSTLDTEHLPERVGLFTIIVLGEIVLGIINVALNLKNIDISSILFIAIGFILTISIWWIYFDYLETYLAGKTIVPWRLVIYSHFFIYVGLISLSSAIELAIVDGHIVNNLPIKLLMIVGLIGVIGPLSIFKVMSLSKRSLWTLKPTLIAMSFIIVLMSVYPLMNSSIFFSLVTIVFLILIYTEDKQCQRELSKQ